MKLCGSCLDILMQITKVVFEKTDNFKIFGNYAIQSKPDMKVIY